MITVNIRPCVKPGGAEEMEVEFSIDSKRVAIVTVQDRDDGRSLFVGTYDPANGSIAASEGFVLLQ